MRRAFGQCDKRSKQTTLYNHSLLLKSFLDRIVSLKRAQLLRLAHSVCGKSVLYEQFRFKPGILFISYSIK